jgi:hypothetical protein
VDVGLKQEAGQKVVGQRLFAIGDLNNDKQNDIITVNDAMNGFSAHYFKSENYKFVSSDTQTIIPDGFRIT